MLLLLLPTGPPCVGPAFGGCLPEDEALFDDDFGITHAVRRALEDLVDSDPKLFTRLRSKRGGRRPSSASPTRRRPGSARPASASSRQSRPSSAASSVQFDNGSVGMDEVENPRLSSSLGSPRGAALSRAGAGGLEFPARIDEATPLDTGIEFSAEAASAADAIDLECGSDAVSDSDNGLYV